MKGKFEVVYKDLETGILHHQKRNADKMHSKGHRIRVYDQNVRTGVLHPLCEWVPGSHRIITFDDAYRKQQTIL